MIYLDNNATTKPSLGMLNAAQESVLNYFGNPSSSHCAGRASKEIIEEARTAIANYIKADTSNIVFTSGGTEANNLALRSSFLNPEKRVLGSAVEHSSVFNNINEKIQVDSRGLLDFEHLKSLQPDRNTIVTCMLSNNETGVMLDPNNELSKLKEDFGFTLHVDAVHGFGKTPIDLKQVPIDMLSASAHKIHGLKGSGFLYIRSDIDTPTPLFVGGSHEFGTRPGTENQIGIFSLGYMVNKLSTEYYQNRIKHTAVLRDHFEYLLSDIGFPNGSIEHRTGNTSNLFFSEIDDVALFVELLSENGLCASAGSACSSGSPTVSRVLTSMYTNNNERALGSVRFSLSVDTIRKEIIQAVVIIKNTIEQFKEMK